MDCFTWRLIKLKHHSVSQMYQKGTFSLHENREISRGVSRIVGFVGKRILFPPPPSIFFLGGGGSRSNFRAITQLETLATQATVTRIYLYNMRRSCTLTICNRR